MPLPGETITENVWPGLPPAGTPISTTTNGTASSGTTETFDTVLGYYQFTAINGHWYEVRCFGLVGNCGVDGDTYQLQVRDSGSSSNPTTSSTLVAQTQWTSEYNGVSSRTPIYLAAPFQAAGSGTHTLGFSSQRTSGSGSFTPVCPPNLSRGMYVVDLGGN
jgi:hypothetical protein